VTASFPPPLVGFNNNVRYRGMRFHIQTEDSGVSRPHIITHLFADGGHVIKSVRTDYSEYVDRPDRPVLIQQMMRDQHRAMALDLRDGRLDAKIDGLVSSAPPPSAPLASTPPVSEEAAPAIPSKAKAEPAPASTKAKAAPPDSSSEPESVEGKPGRRKSSRAPEPKRRKQSHPPSSKGPSTRKGRPSASAVLQAKPNGDSIFGALPQESLDDVILSYVTTKNGPPSRRPK
jgi:hypothetical protein